MLRACWTTEERDNETGRTAVFGTGVEIILWFMLCLQKVSRSKSPLSGSQKTVSVMKENHSPTPKGKVSSADPFYSLPSLSFLPHHVAIAVNESIMAPPIRCGNIGHLSKKVDNVTTFPVRLSQWINIQGKKGTKLSQKGRDVVGEKNDYYKQNHLVISMVTPI